MRKSCYQEIVMAARSSKNAANALEKLQKAARSIALTEQPI